mgnify:CR=1 FL=1
MDHELDVSDLPPPEPFERAMDALHALAPGDRLLLRHRRQPYPLYNLCLLYTSDAADDAMNV